MELNDYLKRKHLEYCNEIGGIIPESDWVRDVLNVNLSPGDKLSYPSVNQWMNGGRKPDANNIIRLIQVFGPEVMPYVGIQLPSDMLRCLKAWKKISDETKAEINKLMDADIDIGTELAAMPVTNK